MKTYKTIIFTIITIPFLLVIGVQKTMAQLNPMGMQYYSNQYLGNPAMAGIGKGIAINVGFRQQWAQVPGAPSTQAVTATYGAERVGLGLNMYNDAAGLLKRTRVTATYAYHLPLNDEQQLHFGVSLGMMYERIENEQINGDATDGSLDRFNQRENYLDGDFGIAYTAGGLTLQGAIPNLQQFIRKNDVIKSVDRSVFLAAISYRWKFGAGSDGNVSLEPKATFRGIKGYHNILDVGFNLGIVDDKVNLMGMYHSSKSATFGLGTVYKAFSIMGMYTTETAALRSYVNGDFEVALAYKFSKK